MALTLPCREEIARDILKALKDASFFYKADFDPKTIPLEKIISPPGSRFGFRLESVTEGPAKHKSPLGQEYDVPQGQVYATINTIQTLAGENSTYAFQRQEDSTLQVITRYVHMMS